MPAVKTYTRVNFQNYPSTSTPLNATNLNKMDKGIDDLDDEVVTVKNLIENMSFDADSISYDNTSSGLQATDVQDAVDEINDNLTDKVNKLSGVSGYQTVDFIGYDATNKKLGLKVGGADSVIPFSGGLAFEDLGEVSSTTLSNGYFSNLDIGKIYLFSWYLNGSSSSARGYITLTSGAEIVNNYYQGAGAGSIQELIFKATSTTVNFSVSYPSGSSGNNRHLFKLCD